MTTDNLLRTILGRLNEIEARLGELEDARVAADDVLANIRDGVINLTGAVDELGRFDDAASHLGELIEAERRRELQAWRDGARAAMGRAS